MRPEELAKKRHIPIPSRQSEAFSVVLIVSLVLSAFLMAEAIASPGRGWLAWVSLLPLFLAIRVLAPLGALVSGAVWGVGLTVFAARHGTLAPTLPSLALLCAVPAIYASLGSLVTRRIGFSPFLLGLGWVGVEFAFQPLGLRHGMLAGAQGSGVLLQWVGSLLGYVFVAFLVAYVNAMLLALLSEVRFNTCAPQRRPRSVDPVGRIAPGISWCLSTVALHALQPRAPPTSR